jgi:two-component system nitrate/nitrite response regulator NarL
VLTSRKVLEVARSQVCGVRSYQATFRRGDGPDGMRGSEVLGPIMQKRPFVVAVVGANALFREGLARILQAASFRIVASAPCVSELVLNSSARQSPTLLIVSAGDNPASAIQQIKTFKERQPTGPVAVVADHAHVHEIISAFRAGANAYFITVSSCDAYIKCLELVMLGEMIVPAAVLPSMDTHGECDGELRTQSIRSADDDKGRNLPEVDQGRTPRLSARQQGILRCLIEGDSNKAIARKIDIAEATVKVHIKTILRKIHVHNRTQAAIWAMNNDLFAPALHDTRSPFAKQPDWEPAATPVSQTLSLEHSNGATSLPLVVKHVAGVNHELLSIGRPTRKGFGRKDS